MFSAAFCDNYRDYLNEKEAKKVSEIDKERERPKTDIPKALKKLWKKKTEL